MAKSYHLPLDPDPKKNRVGGRYQRVSFWLDRRTVSALLAHANSQGENKIVNLDGSRGLVAQLFRQMVLGWIEDPETLPDLVENGLHLDTWEDHVRWYVKAASTRIHQTTNRESGGTGGNPC